MTFSFPRWGSPELTWSLQLSDTLLSILAVRGGEMAHSLFGDAVYPAWPS